MPPETIKNVVAKIAKKGLNYGDALNLFRSKTRGIYTPEEIQEGKQLLSDSFKAPTIRSVNIEDKYAAENPYVKKLDENMMLGLQLIIQNLLRDHYNKTFPNAQSSAAADLRPSILNATAPDKVRFIPTRRGRPTNYSMPTVQIPGSNKVLQLTNLEKLMILYGYGTLSPKDKGYIMDHNTALFKDLMGEYGLPGVDTSSLDMDALRTSVIQNALHGNNSPLLEQYMNPTGASKFAKKMLGAGAAATLADYYFDDPTDIGHTGYFVPISDITPISQYKNGGKFEQYINMFKAGGYTKQKIHIKKKNRGKFTESAKAAGESVQEHARHVLNDPNATPLQKKRANFARNAAKWHH